MTMDQIIYFISICETKSFTKTSKLFFVSQPAISTAIKKLEDELGTELFIRVNNELSITDSGKFFYESSKPVVSLFNNLEKQMNDYLFNNTIIKVGIPPMLGSFIFAPIFSKFSHKYPSLNIKMTELGSKANQKAVIDDDIDVALTVIYNKEIDKDLEYRKISETELIFCVRKGHPFAKEDTISIEEISKLPLILLKEDSLQYKIVTSLFKDKNITPDIRLLTDQIATIKELLLYSDIGAFLFTQTLKENDEIVGIKLKDNIKFDVVVAWKKNKTIIKPAKKFIDFVINSFLEK